MATFIDIDTKSSLREELDILEGQERFLEEALEGGRAELDRARGQESLKACQAKRAEYMAEAKGLVFDDCDCGCRCGQHDSRVGACRLPVLNAPSKSSARRTSSDWSCTAMSRQLPAFLEFDDFNAVAWIIQDGKYGRHWESIFIKSNVYRLSRMSLRSIP